jgi:hypothetical protein
VVGVPDQQHLRTLECGKIAWKIAPGGIGLDHEKVGPLAGRDPVQDVPEIGSARLGSKGTHRTVAIDVRGVGSAEDLIPREKRASVRLPRREKEKECAP